MDKKLEETIKQFEEYFADDINAIDCELKKSSEYSEIIDNEINSLRNTGTFGTTKGGQHYLIEHLSNAVQLQSQRQSLRKDKLSIKKLILDYANKAEKEKNGASDDIAAILNKYIEDQKKESASEGIIISDEDLDSQIDSLISDPKEEE